jgi:putative acetyltransferase
VKVAPSRPAAVVVRDAQPGEAGAIRALHVAAFGGTAEADLVHALGACGTAELSLVALAAHAIVGHVLFSRLEAPLRALALAPLAVSAPRRNSGVGTALVREGLTRAAALGWEAVFVLGEPAYYGRLGFSRAAAAGFECPYAGPHFMGCVLRAPVPLAGRLLYPAPFAAAA